MKPFQKLCIALGAYGKAFGLLFSKGVRIFLLLPIVLNLLLLFGGYELIGSLSDELSDYFFTLINIDSWSFFGAEYLDAIFSGLIHLIFKVLFFLFMVFYGGFIVIIIMSPFFSILSERVEKIETQKEYPFSYKKLLHDVWRGVRLAVRNAVLQLLLSVLVVIIGMIPILGSVAPILLFVLTAFFYGFSFLDFTMERRFATISESVAFVRKHRAIAFANGTVFALSLLLPFCNLFLAGFVATWAVVAGTLTILKLESKEIEKN